jgi:predicted nucleic acid-binding protein
MICNTLLDSCVWIALCDESDSLNEQAMDLAKTIGLGGVRVPDYIYSEVLTRLRMKTGVNACKTFISALSLYGFDIGLTTLETLETATKIFFSRSEKLSFTDCLLLAEAKVSGMKVFTFDKVLERALR